MADTLPPFFLPVSGRSIMSFFGILDFAARADTASGGAPFKAPADAGGFTWQTLGPITLGWAPASHYWRQADSACLFWGQLHDSADLRRRLGGAEGEATNPAALIWAVYRKYGDDFALQLHGQFSLALWDGAAGKLILARDHAGESPLFYHQAGESLYFAATPRLLRKLTGVPANLNESQLAKHVVITDLISDSTCWSGIKRLLPAHLLLARRGQTQCKRYWQPETAPRLCLDDDRDYPLALRAALERAVARRLPDSGTVVCELSAGLDSTTVTALAARQLAQQGRSLIAITAVPQSGFVLPQSAKALHDEGPLAASLAAKFSNIDHVRLPSDAAGLIESLSYFNRSMDGPSYAGTNATWLLGLHRLAADRGACRLLTGKSGNSTSSYSGLTLLPSLLRRGQILPLLKLIRAMKHQGEGWSSMGNRLFGTYLPAPVRNLVRRVLGQEREITTDDVVFIRPEFAAQWGLETALKADVIWARSMNFDGRAIRNYALRIKDNGVWTAAMQTQFGFQMTDALADKELVELCFAIPEEQYLYRGEPRSLIRRAMADMLPPEILHNPRKGAQSADIMLTLNRNRQDLTRELEKLFANDLASRLLDLPRMQQMLQRLPAAEIRVSPIVQAAYLGWVRALSAGMFICSAQSDSD